MIYADFGKTAPACQCQKLRPPSHHSRFYKRRQPFIRTHNETLSIVAMRVSNPDCSPAGINRCDTAPTPTGFAEIVGDEYQLVAVESLAWFTRSIRSTCQRGNQWEAL
jgi:hypothetical protein